jgi:hypothetical protein
MSVIHGTIVRSYGGYGRGKSCIPTPSAVDHIFSKDPKYKINKTLSVSRNKKEWNRGIKNGENQERIEQNNKWKFFFEFGFYSNVEEYQREAGNN